MSDSSMGPDEDKTVIEAFGREITVEISPPDEDEGGQFRVRLLLDGKERYAAYFTDRSEEEEEEEEEEDARDELERLRRIEAIARRLDTDLEIFARHGSAIVPEMVKTMHDALRSALGLDD